MTLSIAAASVWAPRWRFDAGVDKCAEQTAFTRPTDQPLTASELVTIFDSGSVTPHCAERGHALTARPMRVAPTGPAFIDTNIDPRVNRRTPGRGPRGSAQVMDQLPLQRSTQLRQRAHAAHFRRGAAGPCDRAQWLLPRVVPRPDRSRSDSDCRTPKKERLRQEVRDLREARASAYVPPRASCDAEGLCGSRLDAVRSLRRRDASAPSCGRHPVDAREHARHVALVAESGSVRCLCK